MATRKEIEDAKNKKAAAAKKDDKAQKGQVRLEYNQAQTGLNMDSTINQVKTGSLTYALNATVENFDSSSVNYQNEPGNEPCLSFPSGYELIGKHTIPEKKKNIFFLTNPSTGDSEIGFMFNNDCQYQTLVNAPCLRFTIDNPIHKVVHRITNCTTEIYWTDGINPRRYLDIDNIPYIIDPNSDPGCDPVYTDQLDCNQLKIQPNFDIPFVEINSVTNVGSLVAGTYQFAVQYADAAGSDLTSYYSVTNPTPIADPLITTVNFNYPVGKSIEVRVSNLDLTGQYNYFNLAVIKTINDITSVELVGTYNITEADEIITYTGADQSPIQLSIADIFEKYPYYDVAQDLTSAQDTLIWSNLTSIDRINYQQIANNITLQWETHRIPPGEDYSNELNATNYRGYMRDEVYAFEIVFLLKNGKQTDSFHIPGPANLNPQPDVPNTNNDFIGEPEYYVGDIGYSPYWKIYNNATVVSESTQDTQDPNYKGPWYYGNFAYWESTEKYPCNTDIWGDLADTPIRHHKFPDVNVSPIVENPTITYDGNNIVPIMQDSDAIFPIGVKINNDQITQLITDSNLTQDQKDDIVAFKIVRGDRGTNKSVIAKGILRNMNKYTRDDQDYFYPNYPYNQVSGEDAFLQENNNAWNIDSKSYLVYFPDKRYGITGNYLFPIPISIDVEEDEGVYQYTSIINGRPTQAKIKQNCIIEVCSLTRPIALQGRMTIGPGDFDVWACGHDSNGLPRSGYRVKWENPFNDINFDGTIPQGLFIKAPEGIGAGFRRATIITPIDPEFETYTHIYDGAGGYDPSQSGNAHMYDPDIDGTGINSQPKVELKNIMGVDCDSNTYFVDEGFAGTGRYRSESFDPNSNCPEPVEGLNSYGCDTCIKTENPDNLIPWPQAAFGQPTNPLPQFAVNDSVSPQLAFPMPEDNTINAGGVWEINNTFTPAESSQGGYDGFNSRYSRRSCLKCDRDIPIKPLDGADYEEAKDILDKQIFNSPDTSFGQPFLGSVLKLESVMFGGGKAKFVEVKDNAKYKLLSKEAQIDALNSAENIAAMGSGSGFDAGIMFTVYQSYLTIYINGITRKNYGMQFNSRANYDYHLPVPNNSRGGIKQREIELARYLIPGVQSFNNGQPPINNWNRESSVFIDTKTSDDILALPLPQNTPELRPNLNQPSTLVEYSRFNIGESGACDKPGLEQDIQVVSYYASMKNIIPNQWGQINSFQRIDTGYQKLVTATGTDTVFGGDVFISRFAFKTKLPFFIDNRVNGPDDSDIFFDEIGNVAYPKFWHSARSILSNYRVTEGDDQNMYNLISVKAHNFDCPTDPSLYPQGGGGDENPIAGTYRTFYDGYMYLFAYGIPNFYCETVYNTDLRQAFNTNEGDFWPHVSSGIPDDWLQETNVPIAQDNTYYYNVTFSKQNKENVFTQLPPDWIEDLCFTYFPFRAIYSDTQGDSADNRVNNWLVYRALSFHDFPQNYGNLTSLDGMMDRAVLARFENKALLYNKLLTIDTSNPQAAYIGNPRLFDGAPPVDFAETDLGYVGSQHKFLLKLPYGSVTADAKRGQIFLLAGSKLLDLTKFGSGVNRFMTNHLPFEILEYFPDVYIDNHFKGIGLHGVYDSKFDRIIVTKLDYIPLSDNVKYNSESKKFFVETVIDEELIEQEVFLFDKEYFCSKSWTMSFDFSTKTWISFHSYLPNFYIGENNFYYSGINTCCTEFTAILDTPDRSRIGEEDPLLDVIAGELQPPVLITTSTTTTSNPLFTTTTTTAYIPDCSINIAVSEELGCEIDGVGYITVPSPTTTTICARPSGLLTDSFTEGYQVKTAAGPVVGKNSAQEACAIGSMLKNVPPGSDTEVVAISFVYQATPVISQDGLIGSSVYLGDSSDCTRVADGWYTREADDYTRAIYVEDGVIRDDIDCNCNTLTTTTTTYTGGINECCGFIINNDNAEAYIWNNANVIKFGELINIPGYTGGKLALGPNTLYVWDGSAFKKWTINTTNWSAVADTDVTPGAFDTTAGVIVKDDNTLIALDTTLGSVVEIDTTSAAVTVKFALPAGYTWTTNLLYTTAGKLITIGKNTAAAEHHYFEWDYDNAVATPEVDITITAAQWDHTKPVSAIYECECNTTIIAGSTTCDYAYFQVTPLSPFDVVFLQDASSSCVPILPTVWETRQVSNITQQASCTSPAGGPTTTTTTTTSFVTTTTTTSVYPCYKWEVTGPIVVWYDDCNGIPQSLSVASGETKQYCTNVNVGAEGSLIGACDI